MAKDKEKFNRRRLAKQILQKEGTNPPRPKAPATAAVFAEYAKPLTDSTDGSPEQMTKAITIAEICWCLAGTEDPAKQEEAMEKIRKVLPFDDEEFAQFRQDILEMMIERHRRMFPDLHGKKGE